MRRYDVIRSSLPLEERHAMFPSPSTFFRIVFLLSALSLAGCGGGDSDSRNVGNNAGVIAPLPPPVDEVINPNAPLATGDVAIDALNWFSFRRQQIALPLLRFDTRLADAAQQHSEYQALNNVITHIQTVGRPGFSGVTQADRLANSGYAFTQFPNAFGEVLAATTDPSGFNVAESLIAAIYHRFVIFEPVFSEAGTGAATAAGGPIYFTGNFVANGLLGGLGIGRASTYPFPGQQAVPTVFFSDTESPDPVPGVDAVGYPISIHADLEATISVSRFTVRARNGPLLPTTLLTNASDSATPLSAVAIIPLTVLQPGAIYDVEFDGLIDNTPIAIAWSFTTR
jgi:hypothetical protein